MFEVSLTNPCFHVSTIFFYGNPRSPSSLSLLLCVLFQFPFLCMLVNFNSQHHFIPLLYFGQIFLLRFATNNGIIISLPILSHLSQFILPFLLIFKIAIISFIFFSCYFRHRFHTLIINIIYFSGLIIHTIIHNVFAQSSLNVYCGRGFNESYDCTLVMFSLHSPRTIFFCVHSRTLTSLSCE